MNKTLEAIITAPSLVREKWLSSELAVREVLAFERRFGSKHLMLACHAALPLILTPQLINLIHINFLDGEQIPWVAEVDFLLSPLCRPIDEGLFEVEPSIREVLLVELENQFDWQRPLEIAKFLSVYVEQKPDPKQQSEVYRTQSWIAQAYLNPDYLIEEITDSLEKSLSNEDYLLSLPGQIQVVTMLELLAEPLSRTNLRTEHNYLICNSRILAQLLYGDARNIRQTIEQKKIQGALDNKEFMLVSPAILKQLTNNEKISNFTEQEIRQAEESVIYEHLLSLIESEPPSTIIERFRMLFIEGAGYPEPDISEALFKITDSSRAEQDFQFILNRCCYILINRWLTQRQLRKFIPELVELFENLPDPSQAPASRVRRLQELVKNFTETEQCMSLRELCQVISQEVENPSKDSKLLRTLISRYPYLYEYCLLSEDSSYEQQQSIRQLQSQAQRQFELDLSQYITYQVPRAQAMRSQSEQAHERIPQPVTNPTLLSARALSLACKQFLGRVEGSYTYRDLAHNFLVRISQPQSYLTFKEDLYNYLITSIKPEYGQHKFNKRLHDRLQRMFPEFNYQKLNTILLIQCFQNLIDFLIASPQQPEHLFFIDLISNNGSLKTIGLLLKITLLSSTIKPYLEKRLANLINHYESQSINDITWLIEFLENFNIAWSIYFGEPDIFSSIRLNDRGVVNQVDSNID